MENNSQEEIIAGNELIARFMGCNKVVDYGRIYFTGDYFKRFSKNETDVLFIRDSSLRFHMDWNWLMPVIKKCHNIEAPRKELGWKKADRIQYRIDDNDIWNDNIIEVWKEVVGFANWYFLTKIKYVQ